MLCETRKTTFRPPPRAAIGQPPPAPHPPARLLSTPMPATPLTNGTPPRCQPEQALRLCLCRPHSALCARLPSHGCRPASQDPRGRSPPVNEGIIFQPAERDPFLKSHVTHPRLPSVHTLWSRTPWQEPPPRSEEGSGRIARRRKSRTMCPLHPLGAVSPEALKGPGF